MPNWFDQGMNNPLTHLGLGLTQSMAPRYSTNIADLNGGGLGAGLLAGVNSYQGHKRGQLQDSIRSGLLAQKQRAIALEEQKAQAEMEAERQKQQAVADYQAALANPETPKHELAAKAMAAGATPQGAAGLLGGPQAESSALVLGRDLLGPGRTSAEYTAAGLAEQNRKAASGATKIGDINSGGGFQFSPPQPGYALHKDPETGEVTSRLVVGSKAWRDEQRQDKKDRDAMAKTIAKNRADWAKAKKTHTDVQEAMGLADKWSTGIGGKLTAGIPASSAMVLRERISTIKSAIATDTLARMRSLSKTGSSGMGSLSAPELKLLEDSIASLNPDVGDEELVRSFKKVATHYNNLMKLFEDDMAVQQGSQATSESPSGLLSTPKKKRIRYDMQGNVVK